VSRIFCYWKWPLSWPLWIWGAPPCTLVLNKRYRKAASLPSVNDKWNKMSEITAGCCGPDTLFPGMGCHCLPWVPPKIPTQWVNMGFRPQWEFVFCKFSTQLNVLICSQNLHP
jgi:hypothetical protein